MVNRHHKDVDLEPWGRQNDKTVRHKNDHVRQMGNGRETTTADATPTPIAKVDLTDLSHPESYAITFVALRKPNLNQPQDYQQLHMELLHASRKAARFVLWLGGSSQCKDRLSLSSSTNEA